MSDSMDLLDRVRQTIEQHRLLAPGETVVAGVSGGPDSVCLLHLLQRLAGEWPAGLVLHVAHLHHGQRGADADADAEFVRRLAAAWDLPLTLERADVPALARAQSLAFEEAARRARYAFLARVAARAGARTIAVAHNADDQAETILMHLIRGSGLAGLRGMLPSIPLSEYRLLEPGDQGPIPVDDQPPATPYFPTSLLPTSLLPHPLSLSLIRPLLDVPRAEIEAYNAAHGLEARLDRSNLDTTHFRNWLRLEVIPLLEQHNPALREVLRRSAAVVAADYALLRDLLAEAWPRVAVSEEEGRIVLDRAAWLALPLSLQRSTIREAVHRLRRSLRNINFVHVEDALRVARGGTTGAQATLPRGLLLTVDYDRLVVAGEHSAPRLPAWPLLPAGGAPLAVAVPGDTPLPAAAPGEGWTLRAVLLPPAALPATWQANPDPWRAYLDAEALGPNLWLRTRRPGDRFQPLGLGGRATKLADFLTNRKVPPAARDHLPLLIAPWGIAWVCGHQVDHRARVQPSTSLVLALHLIPPAGIG